MKRIRLWFAQLRWWWKMPRRVDYPMDQPSDAFRADTKRWLDEEPK